MNRPSDDRVLGTESAVVALAEIEFRPDLLVRWDDERVVSPTNSSTGAPSYSCGRVASRRARIGSSAGPRPTWPATPTR